MKRLSHIIFASALSLIIPLTSVATEQADTLKSRGVVDPTLSVGVD